MCCLLQLVTGGQGRDDGGHLVTCICSSCVVCVCVCVCVCVREGERESVCMWVHAFVMKWVYPYVFVSPLGSYKMGCHKLLLLWLHWGWNVPYLAGLWVGMGCCTSICDVNQVWIRTLMSLVASISVIWTRLESELWCHYHPNTSLPHHSSVIHMADDEQGKASHTQPDSRAALTVSCTSLTSQYS